MPQDLRQNNTINVIGEILSDYELSHEVYGEKFYNFELGTSRLSNTSDILPVTISERLIENDKFKKGVIVNIAGQIRSYNNFTSQKNKLVLTIFTKDISIAEENDNINPNQVILNGFICKPPVYRKTPFGREIADILLAVNRSYNKSDYIPSIAWGRNAKFAANLNVGDNIKIWGRMQSRTYQKKYETGEIIEKTAYEVSISKLEYPIKIEEFKETEEHQ